MDLDVAIIGASSSGLYAADLLAKEGQHVAVFERQREVNPARRTLIVTPEIESGLGGLMDQLQVHRTSRMVVASPSVEREIVLERADFIIERSELAQQLEVNARASGVDIFLGQEFLSLEEGSNALILHLQDPKGVQRTVTAQAVIGADGILSSVASAAGIPHPQTGPIVQAEVSLPSGWDPDTTKVWFDPERTRFFYWLIPESDRCGVAGLVGDGRENTLTLLREFLRSMDLEPMAFQGARVAMHHPTLKPWTKIGKFPVFLVGDAAGQVKVTTVGGTVTGFAGAEAAVEALTCGTPYRRAVRSLKIELDVQWGLRVLLDGLDARGYDRLIRALTPRVRGLLSRHNRDRFAPVSWRLLLEPKLWAVGLAALVGLCKRTIIGALRRRGTPHVRPKKAASTD